MWDNSQVFIIPEGLAGATRSQKSSVCVISVLSGVSSKQWHPAPPLYLAPTVWDRGAPSVKTWITTRQTLPALDLACYKWTVNLYSWSNIRYWILSRYQLLSECFYLASFSDEVMWSSKRWPSGFILTRWSWGDKIPKFQCAMQHKWSVP